MYACWFQVLEPYIKTRGLTLCPSNPNGWGYYFPNPFDDPRLSPTHGEYWGSSIARNFQPSWWLVWQEAPYRYWPIPIMWLEAGKGGDVSRIGWLYDADGWVPMPPIDNHPLGDPMEPDTWGTPYWASHAVAFPKFGFPLGEEWGWYDWNYWDWGAWFIYRPSPRHNGMTNIAYLDGHAKAMSTKQIINFDPLDPASPWSFPYLSRTP